MMKPYGLKAFTVLAAFCLMGCATNIHPPSRSPEAPTQKFGSFEKIYLQRVELLPPYAGQGANEKAARKIQENLEKEFRTVFNQLVVVRPGETAPANAPGLLIKTRIPAIKFIGGAARFWVGAMAGSSAVILEVEYIDTSTGETLANPSFYSKANAWSGAWGIADNMMLYDIAVQAASYAIINR